jgi:hypothetical protein
LRCFREELLQGRPGIHQEIPDGNGHWSIRCIYREGDLDAQIPCEEERPQVTSAIEAMMDRGEMIIKFGLT